MTALFLFMMWGCPKPYDPVTIDEPVLVDNTPPERYDKWPRGAKKFVPRQKL